jgi:hypothetical protein
MSTVPAEIKRLRSVMRGMALAWKWRLCTGSQDAPRLLRQAIEFRDRANQLEGQERLCRQLSSSN